MLIDYYIWYVVMGSREYNPEPGVSLNPFIFFLWFTFSPGFAQFAYCFVMLEKRNLREMIGFTLLYFLGWMAVGSLSQLIHLNDGIIRVSRNMAEGNQHVIMTLFAIGNVVLAIILKIFKRLRWEDVFFIIIVGTLVELNLELSLLVSGIRVEQGTWSPGLMIANTLVEFNCGITLIYLIYRGFQRIRDKDVYPQLSVHDFRHIKTDFNRIMSIREDTIKPKAKKTIEKVYKPTKIEKDLNYVNSKA